jgi:hypothetical protein
MDRLLVFLAGAGFGAAAGGWLNRGAHAVRSGPYGAVYPARSGETFRAAETAAILARTQSLLKEIRALVVHADVPDAILEQKVRARIARLVQRPDAVQMSVAAGTVTLRGVARAEEIRQLADTVSALRGVKTVDNRLEALTPPFTSWDDAEPVIRPAAARKPGSYPAPVSLALAAGGLALAYGGFRTRGNPGALLVAGGAALIGAGAAGILAWPGSAAVGAGLMPGPSRRGRNLHRQPRTSTGGNVP